MSWPKDRRTEWTEAAPRVLMVLKRTAGQGGMQLQARRLSITLRRSGVPVSLVGHSREKEDSPARWHRRLPTTHLRASNQWTFAARLMGYLLRHRARYDVVHVHGFGLDTFTALAAGRITRKPLVVKPSTAGPGTKLHVYARLAERAPALWKPIWSAVDAWISISEQTRADLLRMGVRPERIIPIPNGVETRRFRPLLPEERASAREKLGLTPDAVAICTIARLTPHKRVDLLIRAFHRVAGEQANARLWIIGDGEQLAALRAIAHEGPGSGAIEFCGRLGPAHVVARLQSGDVFALFSEWEGLSNALLEAMGCGLAPVVSNVSGMGDVVEDGVSGRVLMRAEEGAAAGVLREVVADAALRARLGAGAADRIARGFSLQATAARLTALYRTLLAGVPLPPP